MGSLKSLNEKWHGLPKWAWALLIAVLIFGTYYLYKKRTAANSTANATPTDAGAATDTSGQTAPLDSGGSGGEYYPGNTPAGDTTTTETTNNYYGDTNPDNPDNKSAPPVLPKKGASTSPTKPNPTASPTKPNPAASTSAITVPKTATATTLQTTVAKANPVTTVFPKTAAENHPAAVKVSANKTGASANKTQGVFSIH